MVASEPINRPSSGAYMDLRIGKTMTYRCRCVITALALIVLSGCAAPAVDQEAAGDDAAKFQRSRIHALPNAIGVIKFDRADIFLPPPVNALP